MSFIKTISFAAFSFCVFFANAQKMDYNTKGGIVAKGYDVVSYFDGKPMKGDKGFSTTHDGVMFYFATGKNLNTFKMDPKKYIPQYGGYCAYAVGASSEKVDIDPNTFEIRDGKLYLFYNAWGNNTFEAWKNEGAADLKAKADKNWEKIKWAAK